MKRLALSIVAGLTFAGAGIAQTIPNLPAAPSLSPADLFPVDQSVSTSVSANGRKTRSATLSQLGAVAVPINVVAKGADPTGVANSWSAIAAATAASGYVIFPNGTYNIGCGNTISSATALRWEGESHGGAVIKQTCSGDMVTFTNITRIYIGHLSFQPSGSVTGNGLVFGAGTGDLTIEDNQFFNFASAGVKCFGTSLSPLSGLRVFGNIFLDNAAAAGAGQLDFTWCNDFMVSHNQFGNQSKTPVAGVSLNNSSAGVYTSNFHYGNTNALVATSANWNRFIGNRFEQSQNEGIVYNGGHHVQFVGNLLHTNSISSSGTFDALNATGVSHFSFVGNTTGSFTGTNVRNGISFDATSGTLNVQANDFDGFSNSGIANSSSTQLLAQQANLPVATGTGINPSDAQVLTASTGNTTLGAGSTTYLGPQAPSTANGVNEWIPDRNGVITQIAPASTSAPGGGQTYVYTVEKNSSDTTMTCTTSGGASFGCSTTTNPVTVAAGDRISLKVVTSGGASVGSHRAPISLQH